MTVSSVKNLNGETFSAVQDASLTDIVSSNSANWNEISAYQANSASYLQDTDLTIVDNKVTEISGVPLSAGDELPSGVMNTSALEYNAVNEISGYNGSAIAQYGAEKQWLVHDDTLVHAANSAQYALGVNVSAVASLMPAPTILSTGTCDLNTNVFSGTSYVYWWKLSNGICRIKGWLRPNPANTPNQWNFVSFASGAPSAMFNNTIIPTVIDFGGWADFIHWNEDGTLVFNTREVKLSAANQLVNFEFYGYYKEV